MEYERHSLKNSLSTTPTLLLYRVPHSYSSCLFNLLNLMYYIYSCIIYNLIYYTPLYYILEWFNFLLKSQFFAASKSSSALGKGFGPNCHQLVVCFRLCSSCFSASSSSLSLSLYLAAYPPPFLATLAHVC